MLVQSKAEASTAQTVYSYGAGRAQTRTPECAAEFATVSKKGERIYE